MSIKNVTISFLLFVAANTIFSQSDNICDATPFPICNISEIVGLSQRLVDPSVYQGIPNAPQEIPDCTGNGNSFQMQNPNWYHFVANDSNATIDLELFTCFGSSSGEDAIQYALITDCQLLEFVDCNSNANGLNGNQIIPISFANLEIGQSYFFVVDGFAGTVCDYRFNSISGFGDFPLDEIKDIEIENFSNDTICLGTDSTVLSIETMSGENLNFAEKTYWKLFRLPDTVNAILDTTILGIEFEKTFSVAGDYILEIKAFNDCDSTFVFTKNFTVLELEDQLLDPFEFCILDLPAMPSDPRYQGEPISDISRDTFVYTVSDNNGCIFNQYIPLISNTPGARITDSLAVCDQDTIDYGGIIFTSSVFDTFLMVPDPDTNQCPTPVDFSVALLKIEGVLSVSNCENGSSVINFNPSTLEPSGRIDSIHYVWTNASGQILTDNDGIESQLTISTTDSVFLDLSIFKFGVGCSKKFAGFADPSASDITLTCLPSAPGSVTIGWNVLGGIDRYVLTNIAGDTLATISDTSYSVTNVTPGVPMEFIVIAEFSESCPSISDTIICTAPDCPSISVDIMSSDTIICLDNNNGNYPLEVLISDTTVMGSWASDGVLDLADNSFDPVSSGPGNYWVVYAINQDPCVYTDTVFIQVGEMPVSDFDAPDSMCQSDSIFIELASIPPLNSNFIWDIVGDYSLIRFTDTSFMISWEEPGQYPISLQIQNAGCLSPISRDTIIVLDIPNANFVVADSICENDTTNIVLLSPTQQNVFFDWNISGNDSLSQVNDSTFQISWDNAGTFILSLQIDNGSCFSIPYTDTTVVSQLINPIFNLTDSICDTDIAILTLPEPPLLGSELNWDIEGNESMLSINDSSFQIMWDSFGSYNVSLQIDNGACSSSTYSEIIFLEESLDKPVIRCQSYLDRIDFNWINEPCAESYNISIDGVLTDNTTDTVFSVTGLNEGDTRTLTIEILSSCACPGTIDSLTCQARICPPLGFNFEPVPDFCLSPSDTTIQLTAMVTGSNNSGFGEWSGPGTNTSGVFNPLSAGAGVHNLIYTFIEDGCVYRDSFNITIFDSVNLSALVTDPICPEIQVGNIVLVGTGGTTGYSYYIDGGLISNPDINMLVPGIYDLALIDANMCIDKIVAEIAPAEEIIIEINILQPVCENEDGFVAISVQSGGLPPFRYFIDGISMNDPDSLVLSPGNYEIEIQDANDCSQISSIQIMEALTPELTIQGPDQMIEGQSINYLLTTNVLITDVTRIDWTYNNATLCQNIICQPDIDLVAQETGQLCAELEYGLGCIIMDCKAIEVVPEPTVYCPNIFKPNSDFGNDKFWLYTNDPNALLAELTIFDRWGNQVYNVENSPLEGNNLGWDGTLQGELLNPGVYVFMAKIQFSNEIEARKMSGSITLIR